LLPIFSFDGKLKDSDPRITFNVYRCKSDSIDITDGSNLLATGLREPVFMYQPPEDDSAYYYFVTSSNSFHNESSVTIPAFFGIQNREIEIILILHFIFHSNRYLQFFARNVDN